MREPQRVERLPIGGTIAFFLRIRPARNSRGEDSLRESFGYGTNTFVRSELGCGTFPRAATEGGEDIVLVTAPFSSFGNCYCNTSAKLIATKKHRFS